ncbi:hypothetical protein BJY04DRAFT_149282 [Aspergillus karnatakaensis]|uniref:uncharacterized protein n=1 Tax=Aspergillus karnatakaensis TaxID=1810916 RepID=UPI003CCDE598
MASNRHHPSASPDSTWFHVPTTAVTLWLLISTPLVLWDSGYVLCRPHSMPGGKWHALWSGYAWYSTVDYIYGWPAYNLQNGFTAAQTILNLIETAGYLYYLWIVYTQGRPAAGSREPRSTLSWLLATDKVVGGRAGATALLAAFSSSVGTVSKTLLYWIQEYYSGFSNIGHNEFWNMAAWLLLNGAWIVFPIWNLHVLGEEIVSSLTDGNPPRQLGRPKEQ